jgi:DNA-binding transcriptional ArsR family regulator
VCATPIGKRCPKVPTLPVKEALDKLYALRYNIDIFRFIYLFTVGKSMPPTIEIDCVDFCKALADETRQAILQVLVEGEQCVNDLVSHLGLSQPTISHHLTILKNLGLVSRRKEGKRVYYAAHQDNVVECCGMLIAKFCCDPGTVVQVECEL